MLSLLTTQEAAAYLRIHPETLRRWVAAGLIPCVRVGRTIRFRREALDAWIARKEAA